MKRSSLPTIGFDRFVEYAWAEYALDLAISDGGMKQLKMWLNARIEGEQSARKTFNMLSNLWLKSFPETEQLRTEALILAPKLLPQNRLILHWGMALANFELFQQTTANMGKLLRIQGEFNSKEIQQRMAEAYSNQGTVPRAVSRIIQTLCNWNVIQESDKSTYTVAAKSKINNDELLSWLLQASLNSQRNRPVSIMEVFRMPALFPFDVAENGQKLIRESPVFTIIREGLNQEYVVLS